MQSDRIRTSSVRAVAATLLGHLPDILFGLLVILNVVRTLHHAMWRDEFQAFQIATHSANFSELLQRVRFEGHPGLWHVLLWVMSRFSTDPILMQLLHIGIAVGAWLLVYRCSPFSTIEKFLLILSYFLFWEYFVISRNYALVALFGFGFVALRSSRSPSEFVPWILPGLLANTFGYGTIWSMALAAVFVIEQNRLTTRFIGGMCIYLICLSIAVATMMPPGFFQTFHQTSNPIDAARIHELSTIPIGAFFPIRPDWLFDSVAFFIGAGSAQPPQFWEPIPVSQLDQLLDWFFGNNAEHPLRLSAMLALPIAICWMLVRPTAVAGGGRLQRTDKMLRRQWSQAWYALIGFMLVYIGILLFNILIFSEAGSARHHGILFLALVGCVWSARTYAPPFSRPHVIWYAILILSAISGIATLSSELRPFSNGRNVAAWLKSNNLTDQFIVGNAVGLTIPSYLGRPIYLLECEGEGMFFDSLNPCGGIRSLSDLIDRVNRAIDKSAGREVVLILTEEDEASREFITAAPETISSRDLTLMQVFGGSVSEEDYHIFRVPTDRQLVLSTAAQIQVVEATYGMNCKDYNVKPPNQNKVALGNATAAVTRACEKKSRECKFKIEVGELGDPAYGCDKGFSVGWRCGNVEEIHEGRAAAPAQGSVLLSCP